MLFGQNRFIVKKRIHLEVNMQDMNLNKLRLADQCVFKGLLYLSEAMQYYWPASMHEKGYLQEIAENNIALHLARSFSENGFLVWAEIPFKNNISNKLDFLAYHYSLDILVALELKNNIETPQGNHKDFTRLVEIYNNGICNEEHLFNGQVFASEKKPDILGIITMLNATEFAEWWKNPNVEGNYKPKGRTAPDFEQIGKALEVCKYKAVMPLCEYVYPNESLRYRFRRAAYALYDEVTIQDLEKALNC